MEVTNGEGRVAEERCQEMRRSQFPDVCAANF